MHCISCMNENVYKKNYNNEDTGQTKNIVLTFMSSLQHHNQCLYFNRLNLYSSR